MQKWKPPLLATILSAGCALIIGLYRYETCNGLFNIGFRRPAPDANTIFGCPYYEPNILLDDLFIAMLVVAAGFLVFTFVKLIR